MKNRETAKRRWPKLVAVLICLVLVAVLASALKRNSAEAPPAAETAGEAGSGGAQESGLIVKDRAWEGRWRKARTASGIELTADQLEKIEQLRSIGYLAGSMEVDLSGITMHRRSKVWKGLNFYSSGHAPEAILMDMDGNELHRWYKHFKDVWPKPTAWRKTDANWWRRVYLFENGDILAIFEGNGLIKLDKSSNLIWAVPNRAHHDLEVMPDGDIYVLTREARIVPWVHEAEPVLEDALTILDRDGNEKATYSIFEAFRRSEFKDLVFLNEGESGDVLHTNTLHVLDGSIADRNPAFRAGNVLMAMNHQGVVAVMDPEQGKIVWAFKRPPHGHHDPKILENGNLLLFENQKETRRSIVVELDPVNEERLWEYQGTQEQPFFSKTCGTAQRLPNGNTLITESDGGRVFEVTADQHIVWEFYTPYRAGEKQEFIATLAEMVRLPLDFPTDWISPPEKSRR